MSGDADDRPTPIRTCRNHWTAVSTGNQTGAMQTLELSCPSPATLAQAQEAIDANGHDNSADHRHRRRIYATPQVEVTGWINTVQQERTRLQDRLQTAPRSERIPRDHIEEMIKHMGCLAQQVTTADPEDKADLYKEIGLRMTFYPQKQLVEARIIPEPPHVRSVRVRGTTQPNRTHPAIPIGDVHRIPVGG